MTPPRRRRPSLYEHLRAHLADVGLDEDGYTLPDEDEATSYEWESFMRGRDDDEDGARAREHHVAAVHGALVALADRPGRDSRARARRVFRRVEPRPHIEGVLERLQAEPPEDLDHLYAEVRAIALESGRREDAKFALAVLGRFANAEDAELMRTFARHEEFAFYAATALANIVEDPVAEWLELARQAEFGSRDELVELLVREPRADACAWLLRGGFQGSSGWNALLVAQACDLAGALERERDPELVAGAGEILRELAQPGLGRGMFLYPRGVEATERFLELVEPRTFADYVAVDTLRELAEDDLDWFAGDPEWAREQREHLAAQLADIGWTEEARARVAGRCGELLERQVWRELVERELAREHEELSSAAERAARGLGLPVGPTEVVQAALRLGLPVREFLVRHLERHPEDSDAWHELVADGDAETLDKALALARRLFDFEELARGSSDEANRAANAFAAAVWTLERHPGQGWDLIRVVLQSPEVQHRFGALNTLAAWPPALLGTEQRAAVEHVAREDPDEEVRETARRVLHGEPLDDDDG